MKTLKTKNMFKNLVRFLLGISWMFFVTTAFEIVPIAPNAVSFIKTIFLTNNGSNVSPMGIILEWLGGHGWFQWSVTVDSLRNAAIVSTDGSGKLIASTSGNIYNFISWFALSGPTGAVGATWATGNQWIQWLQGIQWIQWNTWANWLDGSNGVLWAVWWTWAKWATGVDGREIEMWTSVNYLQRRYVWWWWRIDLISLTTITWPRWATWANGTTWTAGHITVINITQVGSGVTSGQ